MECARSRQKEAPGKRTLGCLVPCSALRDLTKSVDNVAQVEAERLGDVEQLNEVKPPLAGFHMVFA